MTTTPIPNIIFDAGGVLVEWMPREIVREFSADPAVQAALMRDIFNHPEWVETDRGTLLLADAAKSFAARTQFSLAEVQALMRIIRNSLAPKRDTLALVAELKRAGRKVYCLSNMPHERYEYLRGKHDFWQMFDGIVISGYVKLVKPDREIYTYTLEKYQLTPETCVFIDDSRPNVEAAEKLGMRGVVFTDASTCREQLRTWG